MLSHGRPIRFRPPGALARWMTSLWRDLGRWAHITFGGGAPLGPEELDAMYPRRLFDAHGSRPEGEPPRHPPQAGSGVTSAVGFALPPYDPELANPINKDGVRSVLPPSNPKYRSEYSVEGYPRPQPTPIPGPGRCRSL